MPVGRLRAIVCPECNAERDCNKQCEHCGSLRAPEMAFHRHIIHPVTGAIIQGGDHAGLMNAIRDAEAWIARFEIFKDAAEVCLANEPAIHVRIAE